MPLSFTDVDEILRIIDLFPAAEIRFEHGDVKLYVKRAGPIPAPAPTAAPNAATHGHAPPANTGTSEAMTAQTPAPASSPTPRSSDAPNVDRTGQIFIESPLMGVYYAAPSPASPPFVTPGQSITEGTDLCIIEVMKLMNVIKAPCEGVVVDIVAENGVLVERGQPLMWIRPTGRG